jgi:hypothetical protein
LHRHRIAPRVTNSANVRGSKQKCIEFLRQIGVAPLDSIAAIFDGKSDGIPISSAKFPSSNEPNQVWLRVDVAHASGTGVRCRQGLHVAPVACFSKDTADPVSTEGVVDNTNWYRILLDGIVSIEGVKYALFKLDFQSTETVACASLHWRY